MYLERGSVGEMVEILQEKLVSMLYYPEELVDGDFGPRTENAVKKFQIDNGLNADGIVGDLTWKVLFGTEMPRPELYLPIYQKELSAIYGNPRNSSFASTNIKFVNLKEFYDGLKHVDGLENRSGFGIWLNKDIEKSFKDVIRTILNEDLSMHLKTFDGSFVVRNSRGLNILSTHAYGFAVDFNASDNPLGSLKWKMHSGIIRCFAQNGWESGTLWTSRKDAMHTQFAHTRNWSIYKGNLPKDHIPIIREI